MQQLARTYSDVFKTATPFPHIVFDNFIPPEILDRVAEEFPAPDQIPWTMWGRGPAKNTQNPKIEKLGTSNEAYFGPFTRHFMAQFNSSAFVQFLETLSGFTSITVDPSYNGCGLHSTGPGGRLMIHTDTNRHPSRNKIFHQCLNLILFLNKDWEESAVTWVPTNSLDRL